MAGGSLNQARRRSSNGNDINSYNNNNDSNDVAIVGGTGARSSYEIKLHEPSRDEIIAMLASKKKDTPLVMIPEKQKLLNSIIKEKSTWISKAMVLKGLNNDGSSIATIILKGMDNTIPNALPSRMNATDVVN